MNQISKRGSCQCAGEGFSDGSGSGTTFYFVGCKSGWYDCKPGAGVMTKCCREGKK